VRECGLKQPTYRADSCSSGVTPRAGVWIETGVTTAHAERNDGSLPVRECGLKRVRARRRDHIRRVTPRAGVWIETLLHLAHAHHGSVSLPVRECGLKQFYPLDWSLECLSLPVRECGLKREIHHAFGDRVCGHSPCGSVD